MAGSQLETADLNVYHPCQHPTPITKSTWRTTSKRSSSMRAGIQAATRPQKAYLLVHQSDYAEKGKKLFRRLQQAEDQGLEVNRLATGQIIWEDSNVQAKLKVVHPSMLENFLAGSPNRTSGILCLEIAGKVEVIWPGDAPLSTLQKHCSDTRPKYLVGPHHGAPEDHRSKAGHNAI